MLSRAFLVLWDRNCQMRRLIINITIGVALFIFLAWYFSNIFFYVVISLIIATILRPLTNRISSMQIYRVNMPRSISVLLSFIVLVCVIFLFILIFVPLIKEQIAIISNFNYNTIIHLLTQPLEKLESFMIERNLTERPEGFLLEGFRSNIISLFEAEGMIDLKTVLNNLFSLAGSFSIGLIAVIFITFFFLYEQGIIRRNILKLVPNKYFEVVVTIISKIEKLLSNYMTGLLIQMLSIFTLAFVGLSILGIKYAASIALFAAVANLIPYMGPILGALFGIIVTMITTTNATPNEYFINGIQIVIVFAIVQLTDNMVIQPLIFSKSVKAHPLEIFLIIFVGGTLGGVVGMIAAIPVYTVLRVSAIEITKGFREYQIFKI
ncbi:AI-2E family transporter [Bacteroidota bacterium]